MINEIQGLISNVGFPIVACVFMYKQNTELQKSITELTATLKSIDTRIDNLERGE